jgi:replication fork clamp-binding protein CrfC
LVHSKNSEKHAVFDHLPLKKFHDFTEVRDEINLQTSILAGTGKEIVEDPIRLTIVGPDVPDLTLIDLPGFTKVDTDDQEKGVSKKIERLCLNYIKEKNTIILALCPATGDIATADSLMYAQKVDPERKRTFGVVTKIDIMDKGADAMEHLSGKKYSLDLGFIGVKCRSQEDNKNNKLISEALKDEKEYFMNHPVYSSIAEEQGTEVLGEKLSELLTEYIVNHLPKVEE